MSLAQLFLFVPGFALAQRYRANSAMVPQSRRQSSAPPSLRSSRLPASITSVVDAPRRVSSDARRRAVGVGRSPRKRKNQHDI